MILSLKSCLDDYVIDYARPERCDLGRIGFAQTRLIEFFGADLDVATLRSRDGRKYRAHRLSQNVSDSTIRREMGVLLRSMRFAAEEEKLDAVPFMKLPPESPARERWLTEAEVGAVMAVPMGPRERLFLYISFSTGARMTAVATVPRKNVDLVNGYIDFRDPALKVTRKRRVKVKISSILLPILEEAMALPGQPDDPVIGRGGPIGPHIKRIFKRAGIDEKGVRCHAARRTFVTWALLNGEAIARVAAAVGDNPTTLERNYCNVLPQHTGGAVEAATTPPR